MIPHKRQDASTGCVSLCTHHYLLQEGFNFCTYKKSTKAGWIAKDPESVDSAAAGLEVVSAS
jgi:hypothetical protein